MISWQLGGLQGVEGPIEQLAEGAQCGVLNCKVNFPCCIVGAGNWTTTTGVLYIQYSARHALDKR